MGRSFAEIILVSLLKEVKRDELDKGRQKKIGLIDRFGLEDLRGTDAGGRMSRTGIVKDSRYLEHVMDPGHPESPERLMAIYRMLEGAEMKDLFAEVKPRAATREELETIHSPLTSIWSASTAGKPYYRLDMDTATCAKSYEAALFATGGLLELIKAVIEGNSVTDLLW